MDPEYQRYKRNYPTFPGVASCVDLLRRRNVKGAYLEAVIGDLEAHAADHIDELIAVCRTETDSRIRSLLLAALAQAPSNKAFSLFVECLTGLDENLRDWAAYGLYKLDTKEARRVLWEARSHHFANPEETARFHQMLDTVKDWK